ncbi:MAG: alkaline phosphatase family protein [Betaproteobacteria bacterium]
MNLKPFAALFVALLLSLAAQAWGKAPALVVVLVIDGLPQEQLVRYRDLYAPGGFKRLLDEGAWFADAHHRHAVTLTAPGHATILTGAYPNRHGIIANEWTDRSTLARVYCTGDEAHSYIGDETKKLDGTSPANLRVSTVGDELKYASNGQSKVIAVSGKDRGAILLAGKRGTAYMYMDRSGRFASSTYYMKEHPEWHGRFYAAKPQDRWMGQAWSLLLPEAAYARSMVEGQPWQRAFVGGSRGFPFVLPKGEKPADYYVQLLRTPFADELTLDFARAAIEGENLGRNPAGATDLLGISLSTHDYVNHAFGPESRVSQDHLLRVDRALAAFFEYLDRRIGLEKVVVALTADHGFMNAPEYSASFGLSGARLNSLKLMTDLNEALAARFGVRNLAVRFNSPNLLFDQAAIAKHNLDRAGVEATAARFVAQFAGVAAVFTRTQLETGALPDLPLNAQVLRAWNRELSGDLYVVHAPFSHWSGAVVTHGSPYAYDTNVPLVMFGKPWIKPGKQPRAAAVADIAPTLAYLLDIRPPAASEGRVLEEILR